MKYIKDQEKLIEVTNILSSHIDDEEQYYSAHISIQIPSRDDPIVKIEKLFAVANREQRGSSPAKLLDAYNSFGEGFDELIESIEGLDGEQAHREILKWLCSDKVSRTNQKTANLFLKWLVMYNYKLDTLDWSILEPYLHVPLDVWVTRLLGKEYLDIGTDEYNKDFLKGAVPDLSMGINKYIQLQYELGDVTSMVNQPRIILDELWLVGRLFCNYRNILCDSCWLSKQCTNPINPIDR